MAARVSLRAACNVRRARRATAATPAISWHSSPESTIAIVNTFDIGREAGGRERSGHTRCIHAAGAAPLVRRMRRAGGPRSAAPRLLGAACTGSCEGVSPPERPRGTGGLRRGLAAAARGAGGDGPLTTYRRLVEKGEVREDACQLRALELLQDLYDKVADYRPAGQGGGVLGGLAQRFGFASEPTPAPRGLYLWGGVGCGKTFIMDLFFESVKTRAKRRVHFNVFMLEVHERMYQLRQDGHAGDFLTQIATDLASEAWLLCFDEFQVTDVADAMLMQRLFTAMFEAGLVMVATSNRPPDDLYKNGLQRDLFLPFIDVLKARAVVHKVDSDTDYRLTGTQAADTYLYPLTGDTTDKVDTLFTRLSKGEEVVPATLSTQGRKVSVPAAAVEARVARFTFSDLCEKPLGAADYLVIARSFATVFLTGVPLLSLLERNELRRLIVLVDTLYEHNVKLVVAAAAPPHDLFKPHGHGKDDDTAETDAASAVHEEVFAFDRTVSRLMEMQSEEYLTQAWTPTRSDREDSSNGPEGEDVADSTADFLKGVIDGDDAITDEELQEVYNRYDANGDGVISRSELTAMLKDLSELRSGSRDITDADVDDYLDALGVAEGDSVPRDAFLAYCRAHGF